MVTRKKIVSILLTVGTISFLTGLITASQASHKNPATPISWQVQSVLIFSIISTGIGCYLAGSLGSKNKRYRYTLDFSKSK